MANTSLAPTIDTLDSLFADFNVHFFEGELEKPVITASPTSRGTCLGWFTCWRAWKEGSEAGYYELNVCADHLNRPFESICKTLLHEMVHLYNHQFGIRDCSRSGTYHNKRFKEAAEAHGLRCERDKTYGWTITFLTDATFAWMQATYGSSPNAFPMYRSRTGNPDTEDGITNSDPSSSNSRRYVCPCGVIIRATRDVYVICGECGMRFLESRG